MTAPCPFRGPGRSLFAVLLLVWFCRASAEPYKPENPNTVLLELAPDTQLTVSRLSAEIRQPQDAAAASRRARQYLEQARQQSDPRYLGYAEAILSRWLAQEQPPVEMLVLQASIMQSRHDFQEAILLLQTALQRNPEHNQALLTLATIHQVRGELDEAAQACRKLLQLRPGMVGITCLANTQSLQGKLRQSYAQLAAAARGKQNHPPSVQSWIQVSLAEMALRMAEPDKARQHFQQALQLTPDDAYLLAAYSDLLLDKGQPGDVLSLLQGREQQDGLLLRLILAGQDAGHPQTPEWTRTLADRFKALQQRGEAGHLRERARFALDVLQQPDQATELAQRNWQEQREPADLLLLLRSAHAAAAPQAAETALQWITENQYEDARLAVFRTAP